MFESVGQSRREETHPAASKPIIRVADNPGAGTTDPLSVSESESLDSSLVSVVPVFGL